MLSDLSQVVRGPGRRALPTQGVIRMYHRSLLLLFVPLFLPAAQAQNPPQNHDITVADYFTQADILESKISPQGNCVAYTQSEWKKAANDRKADLWLTRVKTGKAAKATFD